MKALDRFFGITESNSSVKVEVIAGITTFLTMAYIIVVNANILANAGMDKSSLIIVTCLITAAATIAVGLIAKVPIAMAPGMGLNAFFAYTLVLGRKISWETALGIVFLSGLIFLILTLVGIRERVVKAIPISIMRSISVGIGLFIAFIGLKNLGVVVADKATLVSLGSLNDPKLLIGLGGLLLIVVLEKFKVKGSILIGIIFSTILGAIFGQLDPPTTATYSIAPTFLKLDILGAFRWSFVGAIFALMFTDMFDSVGTIVACSYEAGLVKKDGSVKKLGLLLGLDAAATMTGALLGTSTTTSYVESATGIEAGGRTGLTSIVNGLLFLLAILFLPIFTRVPGYATAPALIIVGMFMMRQITKIDFKNIDVAFPSFIAIIIMPLTYSISHGLAFGFISYALIKICTGKFREVDPVMWVIAALSVLSVTFR
ncbi:MAG: NCS2 family permease [Candidatus Eremiobacteraeota bacterium]|nr:NCS2 family permease [Candidatus Eremiobacteraeota bacterium]